MARLTKKRQSLVLTFTPANLDCGKANVYSERPRTSRENMQTPVSQWIQTQDLLVVR